MRQIIRQFLFGTSLDDNKITNIAWLAFRVHTGLSIAIHAGWPKMNSIAAPGWFVDQVSGLGFNFPSPGFWAAMASWGEFVGGICIALGLLTRFSAIQLAFQFFVIAFLWYNEPEPFTGMYFQHSLFWSFVLISVLGGGRYALDKRIMHKQKAQPAVNAKVAVLTLLLMCAPAAFSQTSVSSKHFKKGEWKGTLTYVDYQSGKPYTMPANITISKYKKDLVFAFEYPNEPKANGNDTIVVGNRGTTIDGAEVVSKQKNADGNLQIITEKKGTDGNENKAATLRYTYTIGKKVFIKRKDVRFDGETQFIMRNEFNMKR